MKEVTLKRRFNSYLYRGYSGISINYKIATKQLEAQLENGVAYKEKNVYTLTKSNIILLENRPYFCITTPDPQCQMLYLVSKNDCCGLLILLLHI